MNYELYETYCPSKESVGLLSAIGDIIEDYQRQNIQLTLRQLYYQLVTKNLIGNKESEYKKVGSLVSRARLGGLVDWDAIEDRVRQPNSPPEFRSIEELVEVAFQNFRLPRLAGQATYVELWVEKDALASVLVPIAHKHHITVMVNRGYSSTSAMRESGLRIQRRCHELNVDRARILYLGDLDPSGEDMVRDVGERLDMFVGGGIQIRWPGGSPTRTRGTIARPVVETDEERNERVPPIHVEVTKVALTPEQVETYDPPPNPVKVTDGRARKYIEEHGEHSWEVDALPPVVLRQLIEEHLRGILDMGKIGEIKASEDVEKARLRAALVGMKERG